MLTNQFFRITTALANISVNLSAVIFILISITAPNIVHSAESGSIRQYYVITGLMPADYRYFFSGEEIGQYNCGLSGNRSYGGIESDDRHPSSANALRLCCVNNDTDVRSCSGSTGPISYGCFGAGKFPLAATRDPDQIDNLDCTVDEASTPEMAGEPSCPGSSASSGNPSVGNPIILTSGFKFQRETDIAHTKSYLAKLIRYFNGGDEAHWKLSYESKLSQWNEDDVANSYFTYIARDGAHTVLTEEGVGDTVGLSLTSVTNDDGSVDSYEVTLSNGLIDTFDSDGLLRSVQSPNGDALIFERKTDGAITTITSNRGDIIQFGELTGPTPNQFYQFQWYDSVTVNGLRVEYEVNNQGRLLSVTYADGSSRRYQYDGVNLIEVTDENGNQEGVWEYDRNHRVVFNSYADSVNAFQFKYSGYSSRSNNGSVTVTNPLGRETVYAFNRYNGRRKITSINGLASTNCPNYIQNSAFDSKGNELSRIDKRGNETTYVRDTLGRQVSRTEAVGTAQARRVTTTWSDPINQIASITYPLYRHDFTYDSNGQMSSETKVDLTTGETRTTVYTRDSVGRVISINGPRTDVNDITLFDFYDCSSGGECGQLHTITNAAGHVTTIASYNDFSQPTSIIDSNGIETTLTYDLRQRLTSSSTAGSTTQMTYDSVGNLLRTTYGDGVFVENTYDEADRLISVADSEGNRISWELDNAGNRTNESITDPQNQLRKSQAMAYDEINRLISMTYAHGGVTSYTYDENDNLVQQNDAANRSKSSNFDALDRLVATQNAISGETVLAYNSRDDLTSVTDPEGKTTSYTYNGFGDKLTQVSPDTGVSVYSYDAASNMVSGTEARGVTVTYAYDALNRVISATYPDASENITYVYDTATYGVGQLARVEDQTGSLAFSYDARGNITQTVQLTSGSSYTTTYQYNDADRLIGMTNPSGRQISYQYDDSGRIDNITSTFDGVTENLASDITRLPFGPTTGMTLGNGISSAKNYDLDYRIEGLSHGAVLQRSYAFDAVDNITAITDALDVNQSQLFDYDLLDRLTFATGGYGEQSYTYDGIGNRLSLNTTSDGTTQTQNYQYDPVSHRLNAIAGERTFSYDAVGNTLNNGNAAFTYNERNRMSSATANGVTTAYEINALGQRVRKSSSIGETQFIYDLAGRLIAEADESGTVLVEYTYLDGEPLAMWRDDENDDAEENTDAPTLDQDEMTDADADADSGADSDADTGNDDSSTTTDIASICDFTQTNLNDWGSGFNVAYSCTLTADNLPSGSLQAWLIAVEYTGGATINSAWMNGYNGSIQFLNDNDVYVISNDNAQHQPILSVGDTLTFYLSANGAGYQSDDFSIGLMNLDDIAEIVEPTSNATNSSSANVVSVNDWGSGFNAMFECALPGGTAGENIESFLIDFNYTGSGTPNNAYMNGYNGNIQVGNVASDGGYAIRSTGYTPPLMAEDPLVFSMQAQGSGFDINDFDVQCVAGEQQ